MDLLNELASATGLPAGQTKGLAGGLLGLVKNAVREEAGEDSAAALDAAIPEAEAWRSEGEAPPAAADDDGGGGLLDMGLSMLGGMGGSGALVAGIAKLVERFGLEPSHAAMAAPLIAKFVESRVEPAHLQAIQPVLSMLSGAGGGDGGSDGGGGLLGGLFG